MIRASQLRARSVRWTWRPYVPRGRVTVVEGDPGSGKSWMVMAVASAVTAGTALPGDTARRPSAVLYLAAEDDPADVIRPRIDAMGANPDLFFVVGGSPDYQLTSLKSHMQAVNDAVGLGLVVIDPIQAYVDSMYSLARMRATMARFYELAESFDCGFIVVRHLTKGTAGKSIYRGIGTIDLSAAVRSIIGVGTSILVPDARVMVHTKSSHEEPGPSRTFKIEDGTFRWGKVVDVAPADLLGADVTTEHRSSLEEAKEFLLTMLADGAARAAEVRKEANDLGIPVSALKRARKQLGVKAKRVSYVGTGRGHGEWILYMERRGGR